MSKSLDLVCTVGNVLGCVDKRATPKVMIRNIAPRTLVEKNVSKMTSTVVTHITESLLVQKTVISAANLTDNALSMAKQRTFLAVSSSIPCSLKLFLTV